MKTDRKNIMKATIISVGNELLNGKTVNSNATFIGGALFEIGIPSYKILTIRDDNTEIKKSLKQALQEGEIVILTGGLGPTHDDITKKAIAEFFDTELIFDKNIMQKVEGRFKKRGMKMPEVNRNQALVPETAELIDNPVGTAPGMLFNHKGKSLFVLPGIPQEMKAIMTQSILPFLKENFKLEKIQVHLYRTTGIPESKIYQICKDLFEDHPSLEIAFLPKYTGVEIRIAERKEKSLKKSSYLLFEIELYNRIGKYIFTKGTQELEEIIGDLLKKDKLTISVAESCTGGLIQDKLTNVPGSSQYFMGGITTYSNESKMEFINVKKSSLEKFGAVSDEVAREMAIGTRQSFKTDFALSTTGIAGPTGVTETKPVGLIFIALATSERVISKRFVFGNDRRLNKEAGAQAALEMLRRELLNLPSSAA
jgi:nicotinamide-nucleotide amidase